MALTFRDGSVNIAAISTPGVAIDIIPPTPFVQAAPSNIEGLCGVGSWGIPNTAMTVQGASDGYAAVGRPQIRYGDLATGIAVAVSKGSQGAYRLVRVTDGTDTAAGIVLPNNLGRYTARSSGTLGNAISAIFVGSTAAGALSAILQFPGKIAERFDNVFTGLASAAIGSAGAGYSYVPNAILTDPQKAISGVKAQIQPSIVTTGTPVIASPGTAYAVNDTINLAAGIVLKVTTIGPGGTVTAFTVQTPGSLTSGAAPTNPAAQSSTSGAGTGATFMLAWVLGPATILNNGGGYYSATGQALTITLQGGGSGVGFTAGSYTPTMSFGAALATAVNNGTQQRGRSGFVVFTPGTATGTPALNVVYSFTGGTDGASGVTSAIQAGQDGSLGFRTGAYCLRGSGMDCFTLVDCTDTTVVPSMLALAIDETADFTYSNGPSDTIASAVALRQSLGFDDTNLHSVVGDWPTFNDGINGARLVYPSLFAIGLFGNLSPEQSPINKSLPGVISTQMSAYGSPISNADNAIAQEGGVDIIGRTTALGSDTFSFVTGRSTSSNTAARGIEYSRLTNFIARSLAGPATRTIVGRLQSLTRADDPTRKLAKSTLDSFFTVLATPAFGSGVYGIIDDFAVQCNLGNNPPDSIQRGFLNAFAALLYFNVVRVFVIKLNGGGNVSLSGSFSNPVNTNLSTSANLTAGLSQAAANLASS